MSTLKKRGQNDWMRASAEPQCSDVHDRCERGWNLMKFERWRLKRHQFEDYPPRPPKMKAQRWAKG